MTVELTIRGDKRVIAKLKTLVPQLQKKVLSKAARTAMRPVLAAAKGNAPRDTGSLAASLRLRALKRNRRGLVGARVATSDKWFKGDQYYGAFQEFGWKTGSRKSPPESRTQVEGKHYVEQAFKDHGEQALQSFSNEVLNEISRLPSGGT